jgi:hypothetical protein
MRSDLRSSHAAQVRPAVLFVVVAFAVVCAGFGESRQFRVDFAPPDIPIPSAMAVRQPVQIISAVRAEQALPDPRPSRQTALIPLAPGLSMISIPLQTTSDVLSDLMPNLPEGSRVWTWSATHQEFVEGFDAHLPFGEGCLLYVPQPTILSVTGTPTTATATHVELAPGWNLIGVPSTSSLPLAVQSVYVDFGENTIFDAMDSGAFGPTITTLGPNGYINIVGSDQELLESTRAYWVYSDGNAELLKLRQPLLQVFEPTFGQWFAAQLGQAGLKWALGTAYDNLNPNSTQNQLQDIKDTLGSITTTLKNVQTSLADLSNKVSNAENSILTTFGADRIAVAKRNVELHFDSDASSDSFNYYVKYPLQATDANKITYSLNVLRKKDFDAPDSYLIVRDAIIGDDVQSPIMDLFADRIVINFKAGSDLQDRYDAMQLYFSRLIGYQLKLSTMIKGAYDTLVKAPESARDGFMVAPDEAANFQKKFTADMQREYEAYRASVERIAASRMIHNRDTNPVQGASSSSLDAQTQVMLGKLDFMMLNAFGEPGGVRIRVMVSPDTNPDNTYTLFERDGPKIPLPAVNSGAWTRVTVTMLPAGVSASYDSWRLGSDSLPEFTAQNAWLVYRTRLSVNTINMFDKYGLLERGDLVGVKPGYFDQNYKRVGANAGGTQFGSYTLVRRASAANMLQFCSAKTTSNITSANSRDCAFSIRSVAPFCSQVALGPTLCPDLFGRNLRREQRFRYFGPPSTGTVAVSQFVTECSRPDLTSNPTGRYQSSIYAEQSNTPVVFSSFLALQNNGGARTLTQAVNWTAGVYVYIADISPPPCAGFFRYTPGPVVMTFAP